LKGTGLRLKGIGHVAVATVEIAFIGEHGHKETFTKFRRENKQTPTTTKR
jgi:hypothetical protein